MARRLAVTHPDVLGADLIDVEVGNDRIRSNLGDVDVGIGPFVTVLQQQPLVAFRRTSLDPHQGPLPEHLLSEELERQLSPFQGLDRVIAGLDEFPGALVPDDDVSGTIVPLRDHPLEGGVVVGMVLRHHGQPFVCRVIRRPPRYRPRFQNAFHLEAEVVVELRGVVLLDDKDRLLARLGLATGGLRRLLEAPHAAVLFE
jgi:hypothetical protein